MSTSEPSSIDEQIQTVLAQYQASVANQSADAGLQTDQNGIDKEPDCDFSKNSADWPFNQLSVDYSILGCPEIDVIEASEFTPFNFYKNYVSKNRPVIINGLIDNWPAMKQWSDDKYLLDKIGNTDVTIDYTPDGRADAIICNGNYPIVAASQHAQTQQSASDDSNSTSATLKANAERDSNTTITPNGLYSDMFAVPLSKKMKFQDFLPQLSHFPEIVYNHNHQDLEAEYLQSLKQFDHDGDVTLEKSFPQQTLSQNDSNSKEFRQSLPDTHVMSPGQEVLRPNFTPGIPYCQRQNGSFIDEFQLLHNDIEIDGFSVANQCFPEGKPTAVNLWMGSSFSHTSLHQDWFENIYCVVEGMKHFVLLPPSEVYWLQKKRLPTVRWVLINPVEEMKEGEIATHRVAKSQDNEVALYRDTQGRNYFDLEVPQELYCTLPSTKTSTAVEAMISSDTKKIYRFYVVDATSGDNKEYCDLDALLDEQQAQQEAIQQAKSIQEQMRHAVDEGNDTSVLNDLAPIDFGLSNRSYLITTTDHLHIDQKQSQDDTTPETASTNNDINNIEIYPLIMVRKGNYCTLPVFSSKPTTFLYEEDENKNTVEETPPEIQSPSIQIRKEPQSAPLLAKVPTKAELVKQLQQDLQVTPWIDVDVEINPVHLTPGTTRSRHQHTNSHIVRYIANVKKGQTLYLPRQWYHSVRQRERTISINYWYDMEFDGHFVLHEFIRRAAEQKHQQQLDQ